MASVWQNGLETKVFFGILNDIVSELSISSVPRGQNITFLYSPMLKKRVAVASLQINVVPKNKRIL